MGLALLIFPFIFVSHFALFHHDEHFNKNPLLKGQNSNSGSGNKDFKTTRALFTFVDFINCAMKEEELIIIFKQKLQLFTEEKTLIRNYLNAVVKKKRRQKSPQTTHNNIANYHKLRITFNEFMHKIPNLLTSKNYVLNKKTFLMLLNILQNNVYKEVCKNVPNMEDVLLSTTTFFHIQKVYGYHPKQLWYSIKQKIYEVSKHDVHYFNKIGLFAIVRGEYHIAVQWLEFSEQLKKRYQNNVHLNNRITIADNDIVSLLIYIAFQQHNRVVKNSWEVVSFRANSILSFYNHPIKKFTERVPIRSPFIEEYKGLGNKGIVEAQFMDVCTNLNVQTAKIKSRLKCYYERKRHPFLYINPVKVEHLSKNPPVYQFYEIIGNTVIENLKNQHRPNVKPAKPVMLYGSDDPKENFDEHRTRVPRYRTSVSIPVFPEQTPSNIFALTEMVSGLQFKNRSENFQFQEYTYGKYFIEHTDSIWSGSENTTHLNPNEEWIATILYYLEVSELGGHTCFCQGGVTGNLVRGSALLWYNIYHNGKLRPDIHHGSCPVIHGHKIILNNWVRYLDNWKNFPCTLNPHE